MHTPSVLVPSSSNPPPSVPSFAFLSLQGVPSMHVFHVSVSALLLTLTTTSSYLVFLLDAL